MSARPTSAGAKAERALLYCLVTVPACWWRVAGKIEAKHIAAPALRRVFELVGEVVERNSAADVIEVLEAAEQEGAEIRDAAGEAMSEYAAVANVEHYADLVRDASTKRELQAAGRAILEVATEAGPAADAIASAQQALASVMGSQPARWVRAKDAVKQVAKELMRRYHAEGTSALPTGFPDLDALVQLEGGRVYGIGARPKIGKSVLAANIAAHLALDLGKHVAVWTGEMPVREYMGRIIAHRGSIPLKQMADPRSMDEEVLSRFTRLADELQSAPIQISDDTDVTIEAIEARARALKAQGELNLLVIDYLGLLKLPKADRQDLAIGHITRRTKIIAKELDVPVILVFQLNRTSESGSNVRPPRPSDARDSGNIEQDLDVMLLLHRWNAYDANAEKGLRLEVALNRSGPSGLVRLEDRLSTMSFLPYTGGVSDSDPFWTKGSNAKPVGKGGW